MDYEVREGYPLADCQGAWAKHRRRTYLLWVAFLGWMPYVLLFIRISTWLKPPDWFFGAATIAYFLCFPIVGIMVASFRCPRCGHRFYYFWGGFGHYPFKQKCGNCGLLKWKCGNDPVGNL